MSRQINTNNPEVLDVVVKKKERQNTVFTFRSTVIVSSDLNFESQSSNITRAAF